MYSVLIIDDESLVREAVKALGNWRDFGIDRILESASAIKALEMMDLQIPDIIITDMKMPEIDGVQFLKEIEQRNINTKVLVISGFYDYQYTRQAIHAKVVDYILKPIDPQDLNNALAAAVAQLEEEAEKGAITPGENQEIYVPNKMTHEIVRYIKENFNQNITLDLLSHQFFVSREHISRSFKKEFNLNLFEFINKLRIDKSKELLSKTNHTIEEIALEVGFSDGNYFSKAFKKEMHMSPTEYRGNISDRLKRDF